MSVPIVAVKHGLLKGVAVKNVDGGKYLAFRGIPYAAPPIGDLRFKDPRPAQSWSGVRDAGCGFPKAIQLDLISGLVTGSEDCLYLNVATTSLAEKRPVVVWIHGGGFLSGSPANDFYGPDYLLKGDIVFVGVAYRLGCFGFLNLDLPDASGNQGLKDQVAALRWVRENIRAFGGDPDNVTVYGESAGASAVHLLTLSPLTQGLIHKVIVVSGVATNPWVIDADPVKSALEFAGAAGVETHDREEALKYLMTVSSNELLETHRKMDSIDLAFKMIFHSLPSLDRSSLEPFMPRLPNFGVNVPLLIGFMSDEGIMWMLNRPDFFVPETNEDFAADLARDLRISRVERLANVVQAVRNFYFGEGPMTLQEKKKAYVRLKGDLLFVNGCQRMVDIQSEKNTHTYLFRFSYRPSYPTMKGLYETDIEGTTHTEDIGSVFHSEFLMPGQAHKDGTTDRLVMQRMTRMLTNFAKTGDPTPKLDELIPCKWLPLSKDKKNYLEINDKLTPGVSPCEASWLFWKPILESLQPQT